MRDFWLIFQKVQALQTPLAFQLQVFAHMFASVAEEMGATMHRTAFSPNIKERRDHSCAVFDARGRMIAQAAHIPVHLGSMPLSVSAALELFTNDPAEPGDIVILNDPYRGGTHLPDITTVSPIFVTEAGQTALFGYAATRAHHADVGGMSPGSMPLSTEIYQEGIIIPPLKLVRGGTMDEGILNLILSNVRTPEERRGDFAAQISAHRVGERRVAELTKRYGLETLLEMVEELLAYSARMTAARLRRIPEGVHSFTDHLDGDGQRTERIPITVAVSRESDRLRFDFAGTHPAVDGNINAPVAVTMSAVYYVARCLVGESVPANSGMYDAIDVHVPAGSILNPDPPHAVAGGNVETSQRVVDVVWGALAQVLPDNVPAAGQGTMNNLTMGGYDADRHRPFAYYETMGGGSGGGPTRPGASGAHVAMSNTWNTPIEALEFALPVLVKRYEIRRGSGGDGFHPGGDGLRRDIRLLTSAQVTVLAERRRKPPYGIAGGEPGRPGEDRVRHEGEWRAIDAKAALRLEAGDVISIASPGGGGWGKAPAS